MEHNIEMGYVRLEVADRQALSSFFVDVVGLAAGDTTGVGDLTFTDDSAAHRVLVAEGPLNDIVAIGVEATDDRAFDQTVASLSAAGFDPSEAGAPDPQDRKVDRVVSVDAPWGAAVELVTGLARGAQPDLKLVPGGFLTAGQGFGHAVIGTTAFDESVRFVTQGLGMIQSDWLLTELAPGIELEVRFFHCNARHHSLALARAPFELPQKLHHIMFETNDRDDTGHAFDRAMAAGLALPNGLGQHDNDRMFSFYVASPAGFQVEVGHGARQITEPWTDDRQYGRISAWGHQPVAAQQPPAV